ncbi:hypothetical protein EQ826_07445 [Ectopseudomonas mendocina]|nr:MULTISPECIES: hypothetical protein [Pseudomonas]TRO21692.1 hypothetical protein EQ828_13815 [Pseudomonas mendocina]TRO27955.1 hypothetical protein EQ826_07445 [Pseudomonas mendocina]TRO41454.1 hypothetical protein EQ832_00110 [Pseudomonas sp. ALS1131]
MSQELDFLTILRRHFPIFISAFYLALFALAISLYLLLELYLPAQADFGFYMVMTNIGMSIYLCLANFLVIRGRPWAIWLIVAAMVVCILVVIGHWGRRAPDLLYSIGLLLSLATLLTLNSKRYRAMLSAMVEVRGQRAAWRKREKKQRR